MLAQLQVFLAWYFKSLELTHLMIVQKYLNWHTLLRLIGLLILAVLGKMCVKTFAHRSKLNDDNQ